MKHGLKSPFDDVPPGFRVKWTTYITQPNGRRIYAKQFGKKAFRLIVKE